MTTKSVTRIRAVLRAGSAVFGLSAIALIAVPSFFNELLGLTPSLALDWSMRLTGITLVALTGNMFSNATRGTDQAVLLSGRVMLVSAFALGTLTLLIPATLTWFAIVYSLVGFGFSAAYAWAMYASKS